MSNRDSKGRFTRDTECAEYLANLTQPLKGLKSAEPEGVFTPWGILLEDAPLCAEMIDYRAAQEKLDMQVLRLSASFHTAELKAAFWCGAVTGALGLLLALAIGARL